MAKRAHGSNRTRTEVNNYVDPIASQPIAKLIIAFRCRLPVEAQQKDLPEVNILTAVSNMAFSAVGSRSS